MAEKKKLKVHYSLDGGTTSSVTICSRSLVATTREPGKVTCKTCRSIYTKNKKWYANEKRKRTLAAKKK